MWGLLKWSNAHMQGWVNDLNRIDLKNLSSDWIWINAITRLGRILANLIRSNHDRIGLDPIRSENPKKI